MDARVKDRSSAFLKLHLSIGTNVHCTLPPKTFFPPIDDAPHGGRLARIFCDLSLDRFIDRGFVSRLWK